MGIHFGNKKMKSVFILLFSAITAVTLDNHFRSLLSRNALSQRSFRQVPFLFKRGWEDDDGLDQLDEDDESLDKRGMPLYNSRQLPFLFKRSFIPRSFQGKTGVSIPFLFGEITQLSCRMMTR